MALTWVEDVSEQCLEFVKFYISLRIPGNAGQQTLVDNLDIQVECIVYLEAEFPVISTVAEGTIEIFSSHPEAIEYFIQDGKDAFEVFLAAMDTTTLEEPPVLNIAERVRQDVVDNFLSNLR